SPPARLRHATSPWAPRGGLKGAEKQKRQAAMACLFSGAGDEARTRYLHLGKVALYRMSYTRISNAGFIITKIPRMSRAIFTNSQRKNLWHHRTIVSAAFAQSFAPSVQL